MKKIYHTSNQGFTLIELMIATIVLSMLIISISTLYFAVDRIQTRSQDIGAATQAAELKIERLRNQHYRSLTPGEDIDFSEDLPERLRNGEALVEVREPRPDLRELTVTISYDQRGAGDKREDVVLSAIIGRLGISQ